MRKLSVVASALLWVLLSVLPTLPTWACSPSAITGLVAEKNGSNCYLITWNADGCAVQYAYDFSPGGYVNHTHSDYVANNFIVVEVTPGFVGRFRVAAVNASGQIGPYSGWIYLQSDQSPE